MSIPRERLLRKVNEQSCIYRAKLNIAENNFVVEETVPFFKNHIKVIDRNYFTVKPYDIYLQIGKIDKNVSLKEIEFAICTNLCKKAFQLGYNNTFYLKNLYHKLTRTKDVEARLVKEVLDSILPEIVAYKLTGIDKDELEIYYNNFKYAEVKKEKYWLNINYKRKIINKLGNSDLKDFNSLSMELTKVFNKLMCDCKRSSELLQNNELVLDILNKHFKELLRFDYTHNL